MLKSKDNNKTVSLPLPTEIKKIGIMVKTHESIFTNGCVQQGYFVLKALRKAGYDVTFVTVESAFTRFDVVDEPIVNVLSLDNLLKYSMFIFSSLVITQKEFLCYAKQLGIRLINQMVGNYYILNQEEFVFGQHEGVVQTMTSDYIDEIWLMPMYENCRQYIEYMTNKPVKICPYVWDNEFIQKYTISKKFNAKYQIADQYENKPLDIVIMEPNLSTHKTSLIPLLMANKFFLEHPNRLGNVYLVAKPSKNEKWLETIKHLEIVKMGKITSFQRMISVEFYRSLHDKKSKYVLISSNIRNGLNFLHLECFTLGVPIIHNCKPFAKNGLYFDECDLDINLKTGLNYLNKIWEKPFQYEQQSIDQILDTYHYANKKIYDGYSQLVQKTMKTKKNSIFSLIPIINNKVFSNNPTCSNSDIGFVTYIDSKTNKSIFIKSLVYIENNAKTSVNIDVYCLSTIDIDTMNTLIGNFAKHIVVNFISIDKISSSRAIEYYLIGNSKYRHTIYYRTNTIPCFNVLDLVDKIYKTTDQFIVGINNKASYSNDTIVANKEFNNAMAKLINNQAISQTDLNYLNNSLLVVSGEKIKQYCSLFYSNIGFFTDYIQDSLLISYISLFTGTKTVVLECGKQYIGNLDSTTKIYNNYGYMYDISGTIVQAVLDERVDDSINTRCQVKDEKYYSSGDEIVRNFSIIDIKPFML